MHRLRKRFGQHFLQDQEVVARIIDAFDPQPEEQIVEIGPGRGALTGELLKRTHRLHAVELDRDLIARLQAQYAESGELILHNADAMKFDYRTLCRPGEKLRLIGNLPYNISTPLLFHLLDQADCIRDMLFMLQQEVVDRLSAAPGGKDYGRLSVMIQWRCRVERLFHVAPKAFSPPPRVQSGVVRLVPHATPPVAVRHPEYFAKIVTTAFAQRRKTLRNSLKKLIDSKTFTGLGIDPTRRAETLSLAEFALLANSAKQGQRVVE